MALDSQALGKINWAGLANYTVQPADMELMHTYIAAHIAAWRGAQRTVGLLAGGQITPVAGLGLKVSAGVAIMPSGSLVRWSDITFSIPAANATLPRIDRVELVATPTNNNNVLDINSVSKVFDILTVVSVNLVTGTPASTPVAPAQTSGNLSIGLVNVAAAVTTITAGAISQVPDAGLQVSAITLGQSGLLRYNQATNALQYSNNLGSTWAPLGSGGGGGGSIRWNGPQGIAPVEDEENGDRVFFFENTFGQKIVAFIKVPSSYLVGRPINLYVDAYSPGSSLNWQIQATASLIRKNQDAVGSTDNQAVVATGDQINTVANQGRLLQFTLSPAGLINGVGVSPGDMLRVEITRIPASTNEDTNDVRLIPNSTEVSFQ